MRVRIMSDLVKRLKYDDDLYSRIEAADRITELETALNDLVDHEIEANSKTFKIINKVLPE